MKLLKFEEQVFFSTVRVTTTKNNVDGASIGTGFIVSIPVDTEEAIK